MLIGPAAQLVERVEGGHVQQDLHLVIFHLSHTGVFAGFLKFVTSYDVLAILVFVRVEHVPQVNVSLVQVVHLADGVDRDTQVAGNAGEVPGIGKTAYKVDVRFLEVAGLPLWRLSVLLNVGLICLFGVYVLIVQGPGTRKIFLCVLDGRFLALRVQHKHALPTS